MKHISKLLVLILVLTSLFTVVVACNETDDEETNPDLKGWAVEYTIDTKEVTNDNGEKVEESFVNIKGAFVADGTAIAVTDSKLRDCLTIGANGEITVPVYDDDKNETYKDNQLVTETLKLGEGKAKDCTYFEIAADAFANQAIFNEIVIADTVKKIGAGAFSGCLNVAKMTVPYVGGAEVAYNDEKVFGYLFGSAEASGCSSVSANYNVSGTKTYYIPDALKEVVVNAPADYAVPAYAFFGMSGIKTITLNGSVSKIGANAFSGCTTMDKFVLPTSVKEIGKSAFSGCTALVEFDFNGTTALETIFQEAFSGCTKLGYGNVRGEDGELAKRVVAVPECVKNIFDKAFYNCSSAQIITLGNSVELGYYCFYGCDEKLVVEKGGVNVELDDLGNIKSVDL